MTTAIKESKHSASGQMLGYLFQLERALFWLSVCESNGCVSIEMEDDVVAKLRNGQNLQTIIEQDKASLRSINPYADNSVNLWKTLCIWLDLISTSKVNAESSRFILCTTVCIKKPCIARKIHDCISVEEAKGILSQLKKIAKTPSKPLKPYCDDLFSYPEDDILLLIKNTSLIDSQYNENRSELKNKIRENLKISSDSPFNKIFQVLSGWLFEETINCWINNKQAIFIPEMVWKIKDDVIQKYKSKRFIEKAKENIPLSELLVKEQWGQNFVKQLENIAATEEEVIDSINDYLRASIERTRYAKTGIVTTTEFMEFDDDLFERWKMVYNRKCRLSNYSNEIDKGYDIFTETINYKGVLAGVQTEQHYTTRGSYHRLSNKKLIGWHPKWKEQI